MNKLLKLLPAGLIDVNNVIDLTDGDSNTVLNLDDKFIFKKSEDPEKLRADIVGMTLFRDLTNGEVPIIIFAGKNCFVAEFISGSFTAFELLCKNLLKEEQVTVAVASLLSRIFWNTKLKNSCSLDLFPFMKWENCISQIANDFMSVQKALSAFMSQKEIEQVKLSLKKIATDTTFRKDLVILHRDLHLDNILVKNDEMFDKFFFIDFEHSMEGPLELELQNSLFWDDEKSLNVRSIVDVLTTVYNVPYNKSKEVALMPVYFADQINLALKHEQLQKVQVLVDVFHKKLTDLF
jgi:hypothetical protein